MKTRVLVMIFAMSFCRLSYAGIFDFHPAEKLKEADYMMSINRPIASDKLINDSLVFCRKSNDEECLSMAYYLYGKLLMYWLPDNYDRRKSSDRSMLSHVDKDVTVGNIYQKSLEYLEKGLVIAQSSRNNGIIPGIYVKMGLLQFQYLKDKVSACSSFDQALASFQLYAKDIHPDELKVVLPKGFKSFEEYIVQGKSEMGCRN